MSTMSSPILIERRFPKMAGTPIKEADQVCGRKSNPDPCPKVRSVFDKCKEWVAKGCEAWTDCGPMAGITPEIHEYVMRDGVMGALFNGPSIEASLIKVQG